MIEVGDLVRIKNKHLKADRGLIAMFNRTRYKKCWKSFRGKQIIAKVIAVNSTYDWRRKRTHILVLLDVPNPRPILREQNWMLDASYLVVHRKAKKTVL